MVFRRPVGYAHVARQVLESISPAGPSPLFFDESYEPCSYHSDHQVHSGSGKTICHRARSCVRSPLGKEAAVVYDPPLSSHGSFYSGRARRHHSESSRRQVPLLGYSGRNQNLTTPMPPWRRRYFQIRTSKRSISLTRPAGLHLSNAQSP